MTSATTFPFRFRAGPMRNERYQEVAVRRRLFDDEHCDAVLQCVDEQAWTDAAISSTAGAAAYDPEIRSARTQELPNDDSWPRRELFEAIDEINSAVFRFRALGIFRTDPPSVVRYSADRADHFRPHQDAGPLHELRRLTFVVQLSDGDEYVGGDLVFRDFGVHSPRERGALIVFPSTHLHVVTPVTRGVRSALVGWVHGHSVV